MTIFEELKARGLIFQTTDEEALVKAFEEGPVSYYTGYDPTADSLHLGHLVAILTSRRLQLAGHKPYALVGGATGLIGDPSFKDAERSLQTKETVEGWVEKIQGQLSRFLDFENGDNKAVMVNNYDWFGSVSFIDFLRDVGKYFTVNYMMSKESVKKRIETGISYTEFAYQIMQGYDFYELNDKYGVTLQIGGSDQWGNMTAGTELLRRKADKSGYVITVPLITDSTGKKFGKSEGNAVWLDATKTTPYEMYQFWLNVMDDDAVRFLKIFTFLSLEEIEEIGKEFDQARHQRLAQKILAREVVTLVHGKEAYEQAVHITEQLFAGNLKPSQHVTSKLLSMVCQPMKFQQTKILTSLNFSSMPRFLHLNVKHVKMYKTVLFISTANVSKTLITRFQIAIKLTTKSPLSVVVRRKTLS